MIQVYKYPERKGWAELLKRPALDYQKLSNQVGQILSDIKANGDEAVLKYTQKFDNYRLPSLEVLIDELDVNDIAVSGPLKNAIDTAINNISAFHRIQKESVNHIETSPGVLCWRKSVAIEKVGLYIPGGSAPLFSTLLMLAIPAGIAGCKEIIVCTPSNEEGNINPAILYAAKQTGISKIYKIGGAQAIGAMAYGTQTIPKVYKIFGPGNQYVTCAKMLVNTEGVSIDMPAGPSEVAMLVDENCIPSFVAADLLSQAEHGQDSQVILISPSENIIKEVVRCLEEQLEKLPRKDIAKMALKNSKAILVHDINEGINLVNEYAPEHLIICCEDEDIVAERIINAGSVFIGNYTPESAGDYASGTNHTLPTNGFARAYSGLSLDSFIKKITFQKITPEGLSILAPTIMEMANAEGLQAHANAVSIRLKTNEI